MHNDKESPLHTYQLFEFLGNVVPGIPAMENDMCTLSLQRPEVPFGQGTPVCLSVCLPVCFSIETYFRVQQGSFKEAMKGKGLELGNVFGGGNWGLARLLLSQ